MSRVEIDLKMVLSGAGVAAWLTVARLEQRSLVATVLVTVALVYLTLLLVYLEFYQRLTVAKFDAEQARGQARFWKDMAERWRRSGDTVDAMSADQREALRQELRSLAKRDQPS